MDLSLRTTAYQVEDRSWLGSAHGTSATETITLDVSAFTANTHYPSGYIPSGMVLAKITSSGLYGPYAGSVSEVQTLTTSGSPAGGTFTLTFDGETTGAIAYNAAASAVQTALLALANLQPGDVTVTGATALPTGTLTITFGGQWLGKNVPALVPDSTSLTGGSSPAAVIATGTGGGSTASNGLEVPKGHLFSSVTATLGGTKLGAALFVHGSVIESKLPTNHGLDDYAKSVLTSIRYR